MNYKNMRILVLDNYDSFTYNLVHMVEKLTDTPVDVFRNDAISLDGISEYDKIILSPGPGLPKDAGLMPLLIQKYAPVKSILGVCLGHQAIGEAFGGKLINLEQVYHGVATEVQVISLEEDKTSVMKGEKEKSHSPFTPPELASSVRAGIHHSPLFKGLPTKFSVGRYHSWVVSTDNFPGELQITATDENGFVMALQHNTYDLQGVQFHPESILTPVGETIIANWLKA
jgi:anthranilate synthase component II